MSDPGTKNVKGVIESDEDTGITWVRDVGKGRLFYCSLGHNNEIFMNTPILEHYLRGIQFAAGDFPVPTKPKAQASVKGSGMEQQLAKIKTYDFGDSRQPLTEFSDAIRKAYGKPEELKKFETALLDVLKSDAKYAGKQYACRELSIIGTEQSVPVLAGMLTSQEYSDMARYALERIPGEAVNKALVQALAKAEGKARIGIVNSLGERSCKAAVADVAKCVGSSDQLLCGAAISALGKIGGPEAIKALDKARESAPDALKMTVYDAYLTAAEKLVAEGKRAEAMKIYSGLNREGMPAQVRSAALQGIVNASRSGTK